MEGIWRDRIYLHLEKQGLIRDSQHGFTHRNLRFMNLIEVLREVSKNIDKGGAVDVDYMDISCFFTMPCMVGQTGR